jgi:hypothetical protein
MYYKQEWANEMAEVFAKKKPNLDELINPLTDDQKRRAELLRDKYKMDPKFMKQVIEQYGPLEWRLPEAHAIYWASKGLEAATENPTKISKDDLITLRRVVYQSMQLSFQRGRLVSNVFIKAFDFGPNLDIIPKVSAAYEQAAQEDEKNRDHILRAHRNFLRDAVYFLYEYNRVADAKAWYQYLAEKYPDKTILDNDTNSFPRNLTVDQYAVGRFQGDVGETDRNRVKAGIEGLLVNAYMSLATDDEQGEERYAGFRLMARQLWQTYMSKIPKERIAAIGLPPLEDIDREVRDRLLDPQRGLPPEVRAVLRSKLGLGKETAVPPVSPPERAEAKP